jgi:hypothetical protein
MSQSEMERLRRAIETDDELRKEVALVSPTRDAFVQFAQSRGFQIAPDDFGWKEVKDEDFRNIRTLFAAKPQQSIVSSVQYCGGWV